MAGKHGEWIFISYRRKDGGGHARALYQRLTNDNGKDAVFFDDERIDAGADFPERLKSAIDSAQVVIAVVGPGWLTELSKRAKWVKQVDYVRLELALALTASAAGKQRLVIQACVGGAQAVTTKSLKTEFEPDLGALALSNAVELNGPTWEAGYKRIADQIKPIKDSRAGGMADHAALSANVAVTLKTTLAHADMQDFASRWSLNENQGVFASSVCYLLIDLSAAVKAVAQAWRANPSKAPTGTVRLDLPKRCRDMAVVVLKLAVDPAAAREWVQSGESAPCTTVGMAALIRAVAMGEEIEIDPVSESFDFRPQRHYELAAALDRGAAQKYRTQVGHGLWRDAVLRELSGEMTEEKCKLLSLRIRTLTDRDKKSFVVTAQINDPSHRGELPLLAQPFNAVGLGREASTGRTILREPEDELVNAFCLCLEEIEQLI